MITEPPDTDGGESAHAAEGQAAKRGLPRRTVLTAGAVVAAGGVAAAVAVDKFRAGRRLSGEVPTVAEYAVARLADLGIEHVFGVPGDFAFGLDNAIEAEKRLTWVGAANELNAAYAADGYARIRGAAILCTTYSVGELSALNGVLGSYAERLPVFHLVGQPSSKLQRVRAVTHHSLGDGMFRQFEALSAASACVSAHLTARNAIAEMERVITEALAQRRPAYLTIAADEALLPVIGTPVAGMALTEVPRPQSDPASLDAAITAITDRVTASKATVVLPAYTIGRFGLGRQLIRLLDASGLAYATTPMDKAQIPETNRHFLGMYAGDNSEPDVKKAVESAEVILNLGGVAFIDSNTGQWTDGLDPARMITVWPDHVRIGHTDFSAVYLADVLERLTTALSKTETPRLDSPATPSISGAVGDPVSSATLYPRLAKFLRDNDIVLAETGLCLNPMSRIRLPEGAVFHNQTLWGSIGWATPAALGTTLADPSRRTVLVTGDGAHQLTANEIGTMGRYGVKPVIIVLNNAMYGIEEILNEHQGHVYDVLAPWNYHQLPGALGCKDWYTARVTTVGELDTALTTAATHNNGCYLEIMLGRSDIPPSLPAPVLHMVYQTTPDSPPLPPIATVAAAEQMNGSGQLA
ncbi:indolepyruvate decarboxylase [Nocardia pseudobrasiliensis]|uniref:Alpha-keto-acid decarboxylase n=2 Tax=Nocardia pseudobrasiliensis TaxID=45979 RepID=A0A370ICS0_9NOCA|nr:indolepyruvate decarboxylase [Nocardia pseudobrasiliensis]